MKPWDKRPFEIRNLFNPAFCGLLLSNTLQEFQKKDENGLPFSLLILVLPLCLHKETREVISNNSKNYLINIVEDNPKIVVGLAERISYLLPYAFEAIGLLMHSGCLKITAQGNFFLKNKSISNKRMDRITEEFNNCLKVSQIIGRKVFQNIDRVTIYTTFGIKP